MRRQRSMLMTNIHQYLGWCLAIKLASDKRAVFANLLIVEFSKSPSSAGKQHSERIPNSHNQFYSSSCYLVLPARARWWHCRNVQGNKLENETTDVETYELNQLAVDIQIIRSLRKLTRYGRPLHPHLRLKQSPWQCATLHFLIRNSSQ